MNIKNRIYTNNRKLKAFLTGFCILLSAFLFITCSQSSESGEDQVTFSGIVTLEDTTDHSGVKVMLFKPIEIDTALTNLNTKYPGIGIEINQRTEFFWREHTAEYTTTTNSNGEWEINKVTPGEYHIVAQADSVGWKVKYNAASTNNNNISLKKAIIWNGIYTQSQTVPEGSFVQVTGNTTFITGTQLTIEAGTIIEFQNNSTLEVKGQFTVNGALGNEIFIVPQDTANNSRIKLIESDNALINFTNVFYLKNGIYFTNCDLTKIHNCRYRNAQYAFELFNCTNAIVENNVISEMNDGLVSKETKLTIQNNFIINNTANGINSLSAKNSVMKNNVIKNCGEIGLGVNPAGYAYTSTIITIQQNDFLNNKVHVFVGLEAECVANFNNFMNKTKYIVEANPRRFYPDTLDFSKNFWGYYTDHQISNSIYDINDIESERYIGPVINFIDFSYSYIDW